VTEPLHSTEAAAARPFWAIASGHFREGRRDEARAAVRRGLAHAPDDPYGHDFLLDVERRLARWGLLDVRGLLFADHAVTGDRVYTDAGAGIKLRVGRQTIEALAGRDTRRGATRFWIVLSRDPYR
jgi:hypothetical protein